MSARVVRAGLRATTQQFSVPRTAALNGLRTYATPAQDVKPPVSLYGVDGTYATALVCNILWFPLHPGGVVPRPSSTCFSPSPLPRDRIEALKTRSNIPILQYPSSYRILLNFSLLIIPLNPVHCLVQGCRSRPDRQGPHHSR